MANVQCLRERYCWWCFCKYPLGSSQAAPSTPRSLTEHWPHREREIKIFHLNILIYSHSLFVSMLASAQYKTGCLALTLVCYNTESEKKLYSYWERDSDWFLIFSDHKCRQLLQMSTQPAAYVFIFMRLWVQSKSPEWWESGSRSYITDMTRD